METGIGSGRHYELVRRGKKLEERIWSIARLERNRGGSQADVVGNGAGSDVLKASWRHYLACSFVSEAFWLDK